MSDQSNQNPTPTVQVKEVGLPEQASVGKVLAVAGVAGAAVAGIVAMLTEKEQKPATKAEAARAYLQSALENAQGKDLAKMTRKDRKRAQKNLRRSKTKVIQASEDAVMQSRARARESASTARGEFASFLNTLKGGGIELERLAEEFAESTLMSKLKEFGEEARVIAEQSKTKSADAAHKAQKDLIPQAKEAARHAKEVGKERAAGVADRAKSDFIPAAQKATADVSAQAREVADKTLHELIPNAQKVAADVGDQARNVAGTVSADAEKLLADAAHTASEKSRQAGTAVQRGGRETRSLLLWLSMAGILIFTVFLDEDQQKKLKEIAVEVFGEARDMYGDMKGDKQNN